MEDEIKQALTNDIPHLKRDVAVIKATLGHHGKLLYIIIATILAGAGAIVLVTVSVQ